MRAAVADRDGTIDFYRSSSIFFWSSSTDPAIAKGAVQRVTVPAMTMGSVLAQAGFPRVDLLKMDIDHVMISGKLSASTAEVIDAGASDHRPVVVTIAPK